MQTPFRQVRPGGRGHALVITLLFLAVVLMIFASLFYWAGGNAQMTLRNNQYNMSQATAEAAVESVIGKMYSDFIGQNISDPSAYVALPAKIDQSSWPVQYAFSDTAGITNQISIMPGPITNILESGLYKQAQRYNVIATATPVGQPQTVPATIHESVDFDNIPLFQFAIFYNVNLEFNAGAAQNITGPVFCNQSIWEGSSNVTFYSTVSAVGTNDTTATDPFDTIYHGNGGHSKFLQADQPVDHYVPALMMPIGTNNDPQSVLAMLNLPPPDYTGIPNAYTPKGLAYMANGADLIISNAPFGTNYGSLTPRGTNFTIYFQDSSLLPVPNDYYILKIPADTGLFTNYVTADVSDTNRCYTNVQYAGYSFVTNALFYDWREGWHNGNGPAKTVQAVQIDIAAFNAWLTNPAAVGGSYYNGQNLIHKNHNIDSIYVYNSVPLTSTTLPAVRLVNGRQLPTANGLTVATPFPMYVLKNFNSQDSTGSSLGANNTRHTSPAALMADSITILSTSWDDANSFNKTSWGPPAGDTTVNAAMLEGIVESIPGGDYSGGVENFLRLLENWDQRTLTYNGSIVVLFDSQYATNHWKQVGNYYYMPKRNWAFDLNFTNRAGLPPLTPSLKTMTRKTWATQ
jgi:hypothetical protein